MIPANPSESAAGAADLAPARCHAAAEETATPGFFALSLGALWRVGKRLPLPTPRAVYRTNWDVTWGASPER